MGRRSVKELFINIFAAIGLLFALALFLTPLFLYEPECDIKIKTSKGTSCYLIRENRK